MKNLNRICMTAQLTNLSLELLKHLSDPKNLSASSHLNNPTHFKKLISNHFKFKTKLILFVPRKSLTCYKPNFFRHIYDFSVGWIVTFDLQWRVRHYLKRLPWPNLKRNKITNIKTRLNVLTNVNTTFLNGDLEASIYMMQPDGFIAKSQEHLVCKLHKSIYRLKQASHSWNRHFDQAVKTLDFKQNEDEPYVYKKMQGSMVVFLVLYINDILLIRNDVRLFSSIKIWLSS